MLQAQQRHHRDVPFLVRGLRAEQLLPHALAPLPALPVWPLAIPFLLLQVHLLPRHVRYRGQVRPRPFRQPGFPAP